MTFTYDVQALGTDLAKVRLEIGDTESAAPLFADEEILAKLEDRAGGVLLTAADLCDILARRFARRFDFKSDNQTFNRSQMSKQYAALADQLRDRASGVTSIASTRVDGYSQDIDSEAVRVSGTTARGRYFRLDDAPPL